MASAFQPIFPHTRAPLCAHKHQTIVQLTMISTSTLYVLIACEESQAECLAFRHLGHVAYSCDLQPARFEPAYHIQGDCTPLLAGSTDFVTQDGQKHHVPKWDLIIAHPPCTYLCRMSSIHMIIHGVLQEDRFTMMKKAREFFFMCLQANCHYVAVENPLPMARAQLPKPSCFIEPSWFGVKYTKKTLYWLKNLPPIMPTIEHPKPKSYIISSRGKYRSRTFPQVADALAQQWSSYIIAERKVKSVGR